MRLNHVRYDRNLHQPGETTLSLRPYPVGAFSDPAVRCTWPDQTMARIYGGQQWYYCVESSGSAPKKHIIWFIVVELETER